MAILFYSKDYIMFGTEVEKKQSKGGNQWVPYNMIRSYLNLGSDHKDHKATILWSLIDFHICVAEV